MKVENLRETSPKIGLKVNINAPVIKVPIDRQSKDGVIIDLGRLQVNNGLKYLNTPIGHVLTDVMNIGLDSFQVVRYNYKTAPLQELWA